MWIGCEIMINNRPLYVTLDTNIVVSNKFDFSETSSLSVLAKHVNSGKIKIVLSRNKYVKIYGNYAKRCFIEILIAT